MVVPISPLLSRDRPYSYNQGKIGLLECQYAPPDLWSCNLPYLRQCLCL